jgi:steroid 5-alpha reductase family enzyme
MAAFVSTYNGLLNTINSLVYVYQVSRGKTNPLASNWMQYVGFAMVLTGAVGEIMIEETRKVFKKNPANKERVHDTGKCTWAMTHVYS